MASNEPSNAESNESSNVQSNVGPRFKLAPIRSLDDFLLSSARFQVPENLKQTVTNNLRYYQTNYLILVIVLIVLIGIINPFNMLTGLMANAISIMMTSYVAYESKSPLIVAVISLLPSLPLILTFIGIGLIAYVLFDGMVFVLFSYPFLILPVLIHASLRKRTLPDNQEPVFYGIL